MRRLLLLLPLLMASCDEPKSQTPLVPPATGDTAESTTNTTTPPVDSDAPPDDSGDCDCDDGLWCNGEETCDDDGNCIEGTPPEPVDDGDPCTIVTECDEDSDSWVTETDLSLPACAPAASVPTVGSLDYAYAYWPKNFRPTETWPATEVVRHFLTGFYGVTWDDTTGSFDQMGSFTDGLGMIDALDRDNSELEGLTGVSVRYEAGTAASPKVANSFLGNSSSTVHRSRTIDGGRFMNRLYIPTVSYSGDGSLNGEVQVASSPRHLVLTHTVSGGSASAGTARIVMDGELTETLTTVTDWTRPHPHDHRRQW